jgi:thiol-disulfide isomerase/thioredoxin
MVLPLVLLSAHVAWCDDPVRLSLVSSGAAKSAANFMPLSATLSATPPLSLKRPPEGLRGALYAELPIKRTEGENLIIILDELPGRPAKLFVDANGNGDLTDDPSVSWTPAACSVDGATVTRYEGGAMTDIGSNIDPVPVRIEFFRFDPANPKFADRKHILNYTRDYAYEGEILFTDRHHRVMLCDDNVTGDFRGEDSPGKHSGVRILIDANNNGKFDSQGESFDVRHPFSVNGRSYEIADMSRTGDSFRIVPRGSVAKKPAAPSINKVLAFQAKTTDGKTVKFPSDFSGKIVLLDFWATWCNPCMEEMPDVVQLYKEFHHKGFEIQGVSLDQENTLPRMPDIMKSHGMVWPQIADGKGWDAALVKRYNVRSIPWTILVDGTTGEVLGSKLRGKNLRYAVEKAMKDRAKR